MSPIEPQERALGAWRVWLEALASDVEAALAAAFTYVDLPRDVRKVWLDALDADVPTLGVPAVAVYAPLLAVEEDEELRLRMQHAMGPLSGRSSWRAWLGEPSGGAITALLVRTLYLDFVELLICRVVPDGELLSATHEPLSDGRRFKEGASIDGAPFGGGTLRQVPMEDAVEVLAHAVVAQRRQGRPLPEVMARFSYLFTPIYAGSAR
ncbi:MAG TPA: hypothetical protein VNO21_27775 [Polyangiaceae bacterium]|nr:hypothetical protein [Polyangiaceae bacterium]